MVLTYALLIVMAIVCSLSCGAVSLGGNRNRCVNGTDVPAARVLIFLVFLTLIIFSGFRGISALINDEYAYRNRVLSMTDRSLMSALSDGPEKLDNLINWISSRIMPGESQWILFSYSLITYSCFIYIIYKYCDFFELGILLLFLLNIVNVSFNTMQQMTAVAVASLGIPFIFGKKFFKYLIVIIVATLIHNSAIMLIAVYFVANMKPWSGKFIGIASAFVVVMALFNTVAPNFFSSVGMLEEYGDSYGQGVRIITVLVAFIPLVFTIFFRSILPQDDDTLNCTINMAMIYAMIYLVSTQNLYVARFAMYLQPYLIILYTRAMSYLKKENYSAITYFVLVVGYGATLIYFTKDSEYHFQNIFK